MNSPSELPESTFPEYQFPPDFQPHKAEVVEPEYAHESDKFKLSGPDASGIPIVTEFLQSFPKKDLWVVDARNQKEKQGQDHLPPQCARRIQKEELQPSSSLHDRISEILYWRPFKYRLVLNKNNPPDLCYEEIKNGIRHTRVLDSTSSGFQLTPASILMLKEYGGMRYSFHRRTVVEDLKTLRQKEAAKTLNGIGMTILGIKPETVKNTDFRNARPCIPKNPERLHNYEIMGNLEDEFNFQRRVLREFGITEETYGMKPSVYATNGIWYVMPSWKIIQNSLDVEDDRYMKKYRQGFTRLLVVPFGMTLHNFIRNVSREKSMKDIQGVRHSCRVDSTPWVVQDGGIKLQYEVKKFDPDNHEGRWKKEITERVHGWQIALVEPHRNIPQKGQGKILKGRPQRECGQSAARYLEDLNNTNVPDYYRYEQGFTPEMTLALHMTGMMEGQPYDTDCKNYNIGVYGPDQIDPLTRKKGLTLVSYCEIKSNTHLSFYSARVNNNDSSTGVRTAVPIPLVAL